MLDAGMTQLTQAAVGECCAPMNVPLMVNILQNSGTATPNRRAAVGSASRNRASGPRKKVRLWVQDVFRCHFHETTVRSANSLVAMSLAGVLNHFGEVKMGCVGPINRSVCLLVLPIARDALTRHLPHI